MPFLRLTVKLFPFGFPNIIRVAQLMERFLSKKLKLKWAITRAAALKTVRGASFMSYPGWINPDIDTLDLPNAASWQARFGRRRAQRLRAERVGEPLTDTNTCQANSNCFTFPQTGGQHRLAVPDGFHPDPTYRKRVRPGGAGAGANDHKILYACKTMARRLEQAGLPVTRLEYSYANGPFPFAEWSKTDGSIARSERYDLRSQVVSLAYTSLIVDPVKP